MKDEALKLALACVEAWDRGCDRDAYWRDIDECVAAIKQALAAPVQKRPQNCGTGYCSCVECVMEPAPVQEPYAWHYKNAAGVSAWHFEPSKMFDADSEASKMWPRAHQLIPVYTTQPPAQPAPASWMEMVTANLVREGVNKHKARELAEHFYSLAQPAAVQNIEHCIWARNGNTHCPHTAAQRQWQSLTEQEQEELWDEAVDRQEHFCSQYGDFADAIEAKLKEKNNG